MNVPGWCSICRRMKQVRLSLATAAMMSRGGVTIGICAECEDDTTTRSIK